MHLSFNIFRIFIYNEDILISLVEVLMKLNCLNFSLYLGYRLDSRFYFSFILWLDFGPCWIFMLQVPLILLIKYLGRVALDILYIFNSGVAGSLTLEGSLFRVRFIAFSLIGNPFLMNHKFQVNVRRPPRPPCGLEYLHIPETPSYFSIFFKKQIVTFFAFSS